MKKYLIPLLLVIIFLLISKPVFGYDLLLDCAQDDCTLSGATPLFSSSDHLYPGALVSKVLKIKNTSSETKRIGMKLINYSVSGNLDKTIKFTIKNSANTVIWENLFSQLSSGNEIELASLNPGSEDKINFTAIMDDTAGDNYQAKNVNFDIRFGFFKEDELIGGSSESSEADNNDSSDTSTTDPTGTPVPQGVITSWAASTYNPDSPIPTKSSVLGTENNTSSVNVSAQSCKNPLWFFLLVVLFEIISFQLRRNSNIKMFKEYVASQLIISLFFTVICWKLFCPVILFVLVVLINFFAFYRLYRRLGKFNLDLPA